MSSPLNSSFQDTFHLSEFVNLPEFREPGLRTFRDGAYLETTPFVAVLRYARISGSSQTGLSECWKVYEHHPHHCAMFPFF